MTLLFGVYGRHEPFALDERMHNYDTEFRARAIGIYETGSSPATQTTLLRVLDTSTFRHVGGTKEIRVDVRILAATNRDLSSMVRKGLFREDLFYRLSTITIEVPPLRARAGDVELLAKQFITGLNERFRSNKEIADAALKLLQQDKWPSNVRELFHVVESAHMLCEGSFIYSTIYSTRASASSIADP